MTQGDLELIKKTLSAQVSQIKQINQRLTALEKGTLAEADEEDVVKEIPNIPTKQKKSQTATLQRTCSRYLESLE